MEREPVEVPPVIPFEAGGEQFLICATSDKIDYFPGFGAYILKIFDEEQGMVGFTINEDTARLINEQAGVPYALRESISPMEYEGWLSWQVANVSDDTWL